VVKAAKLEHKDRLRVGQPDGAVFPLHARWFRVTLFISSKSGFRRGALGTASPGVGIMKSTW
jgi:hypothetical protein